MKHNSIFISEINKVRSQLNDHKNSTLLQKKQSLQPKKQSLQPYRLFRFYAFNLQTSACDQGIGITLSIVQFNAAS